MLHVSLSRWRLLPALFAMAACASLQAADGTSCAPACKECSNASALRRTKIVSAAYPELALKYGYGGTVELQFTIQPDGSTADIEVLNADPAGLFEESAIEALSQWRYEPIIRDGQPVAQRAVIRIKFSPGVPQTSI